MSDQTATNPVLMSPNEVGEAIIRVNELERELREGRRDLPDDYDELMKLLQRAAGEALDAGRERTCERIENAAERLYGCAFALMALKREEDR